MLQPQPPGFVNNIFTFSFDLKASEASVWQWLNDTKTFTDTQYWPYRVEFYSPDSEKIPTGFNEGVLTNHHGPFINFAGQLVKVEKNKYRDLQYVYGSYALSFRWIRPYRLEFKTETTGDKTTITGILSCYVKPSFDKLWTKAQGMFWSNFKSLASKSIIKAARA